jgi:hypothetical protein
MSMKRSRFVKSRFRRLKLVIELQMRHIKLLKPEIQSIESMSARIQGMNMSMEEIHIRAWNTGRMECTDE